MTFNLQRRLDLEQAGYEISLAIKNSPSKEITQDYAHRICQQHGLIDMTDDEIEYLNSQINNFL